jgi:hypothetical protein
VRGQGGDATEEEGDGPKTRTRSRSPGYDVTNSLCLLIEVTGRRPHQLATAGRRSKCLYFCQGRKAAARNMKKQTNG